MTNQDFIKMIDANNGVPTSTIINALISDNKDKADHQLKLWEEYKGEVSINNRSFTNQLKINNKLANDYRGVIVRQTVGYMFGSPLTYLVSKDLNNYDKINNELQKFLKINNYDDLDATTEEYASVCGVAYRLLYIDPTGVERMMLIKPWEAVILTDISVDETKYAMIYYDVTVKDEKNRSVKKKKIEWYTDRKVYFFIGDKDDKFIEDLSYGQSSIDHMFDYVPVIKFSNNNLEQGDFEKVRSLIDAYDKTISDAQNELEEFRMAYMKMKGVSIDDETLQLARRNGAFEIPENGDIDFITKKVDVEALKLQLKELDRNIYLFSDSVNYGDEKFSGAIETGISRAWKMVSLINKVKTKQRKYIKSLRDLFKVLSSAWAKRNIKVNHYDITFNFNHDMPIDLSVQDIVMLRNLASDETLLAQLSFIADVDVELEKRKAQNEENQIDLSDIENDQ